MTEDVKPASLADIVQTATRVERSATICVAGSLTARFDALEHELAGLVRTGTSDSLGGDAATQRRLEVAEQIEALRVEMAAHEHRFTFQALHPKEWSDLVAEHPARKDAMEAFNVETFPLAACLACLHSVNDEEVGVSDRDVFKELWVERLNEGQRGELFDAAWAANTGRMSVPFSVLASKVLQPTEEK